jgi:hypothetical protein
MEVIFLGSLLLGIAKHGVAGRELQVAGRIESGGTEGEADGWPVRAFIQWVVTVADDWFLHIVARL